jgi:hypothetical protein
MKKEEMLILGGAALAVLFILKKGGAASAAAAVQQFTKEIFDAGGKTFANGWRYFNDGTAISPEGDYFMKGQLVYKAQQYPTGGNWT